MKGKYMPLSAPRPTFGGRLRISTGKQLLGAAIVTAALAILACTSAAPSECIKATEEAGLPESVIEQLKKPGDLNAIERVALREVLKKAGLGDICDQID